MPYIKQDRRNQEPKTAGELNYHITRLAHEYINRVGMCYQTLNDVIGALEGCKMELYRKVAAGYEDIKQAENGSVSGLDE